jgi:outer membrane murein-binding lipoprotein Lpp
MLAIGLVAVLAAAGSALAAGSRHQARTGARSSQVASLQLQVADLGAQVKALTKQVAALKKQQSTQLGYIDSIYDQETCIATLSADALEGTWLVIDKIAQPALNTTFFGTPSPVDDKGVCSRFKISRTLLQVPPNLSALTKMINWLQG